jgi:vanillate O-demethylase monooxygenase subunit
MRRNYPLNCWYVAATSDEVSGKPLGRRLLDLAVVLYRRRSGEVVAMEDRCLHRAFPLSVGRVVGDRIVCGYHGFEYGPDGACVKVPSQESVPAGACVRTYAVHEQPPFVWIWLGDPGSAALRPVPRTPWLEDPQWASTGTRLHVQANYMLLHEHYLDLTNVFVMHPEAVPPGIESLPQPDRVEVSEMSVSYSRELPAARLADWEAEATGLPRDTVCARTEQGTFVSPGLHVQRYAIEPEGQRPFELVRIQGFTPDGPYATHVFLRIARSYATDRTVVAGHLQAMFAAMAERDAAVLEMAQGSLRADRERRRDLNVKADRAGVRARRVAEAMVAEEAGPSAALPGLSRG